MDRFKPKKVINYLSSYAREAIPSGIWQLLRPDIIKEIEKRSDKDEILSRVRYYNRLDSDFVPTDEFIRLKDLWSIKSSSMYKHDMWRTSRWFDQELKWKPEFGDVNWVCGTPSIVKSRPISPDNSNNIILKLDRCRHFNFIRDPYRFGEKLDKSIFMADIGDTGKMNRVEFMNKYFGSDICFCGSIRNLPGLPDEWLKPKMKIREMLRYKFILALEGNDVATNLKWIMSSNSIAVMPRPSCETWFMEQTLKPDFHYIEIRSDYSDLEEKTQYYIRHPDKASAIIANAHEYIRQFMDDRKEDLTEYLVLLKYFQHSSQIGKNETPFGNHIL